MQRLLIFLFSLLLVIKSSIAEPLAHRLQNDFLLGMFFASQVERYNKVIKDHPDWERIVEISSRITRVAGSGMVYSFQIIEAPMANAFALPGGFIFITDKLLNLDLSDDELAFLIGHEICHIQNHHFARMQSERSKVSAINSLATIGAIILMSQSKPRQDFDRRMRTGDIAREGYKDPHVEHAYLPPHLAPLLATNIFGTLYLLHSQREYEFEADISGARLALAAGYDLQKGTGMLEKLFYTNYRNSKYLKWQTHPLTQERMHRVKSKLSSLKSSPKKSIDSMNFYREQYASRILDIYEALDHWEKPSVLKSSKYKQSDFRKLLLDRVSRISQDEVIQRRALRLKINNHLKVKIKKMPFMVGDYGLYYEELLKLKSIGGVVDNETLKNALKNRNLNLEKHLVNMNRSTPGYELLKYMIINYPNHELISQWKIEKWLKEPNKKQKIIEAKELLNDNRIGKKIINHELDEMVQANFENPWIYRKLHEVLNREIDPQRLEQIALKCEDLKEITTYLHEFPTDKYLDPILKRKTQLLERNYRAGRLAGLSGQEQKAVEAYREILLYDAGSEMEKEARSQIHLLNTIQE